MIDAIKRYLKINRTEKVKLLYPHSVFLDRLLILIMESKIPLVSWDDNYLYFQKNNIQINVWNNSKPYAWLNNGQIFDHTESIKSWETVSPSLETYNKFNSYIKELTKYKDDGTLDMLKDRLK